MVFVIDVLSDDVFCVKRTVCWQCNHGRKYWFFFLEMAFLSIYPKLRNLFEKVKKTPVKFPRKKGKWAEVSDRNVSLLY